MEPKKKLTLTPLFSFFFLLSSCSTAQKVSPPVEVQPVIQSTQFHQIDKLNQRIQELEIKILSLNDKLEANLKQRTPAQASRKSPIRSTQSQAGPQDEAGERSTPVKTKSDPEFGFSDDTSIRSYRKAMIYFQARKFPEAILELTQFLSNYPDHILAGSAQYFCGESYYQQREYNLALREFQSVINSYPHSQHIADTLVRISEIQKLQKNLDQSTGAASLLNSLFPHSPAATDREKDTSTLVITPTVPVIGRENQTEPSKEVLRNEDHGT